MSGNLNGNHSINDDRARPFTGVATALVLGVALLSTPARAQSVPSLVLEGQGNLGPTDTSCTTASATCPGQFTATLSGQLGQPVSSGMLQLSFQIENEPIKQTKMLKMKGQLGMLEDQIQALQQEINSLKSGSGPRLVGGLPSGCYSATGTGSFQGTQFSAGFNGKFCVTDGSQVELAGPVAIVQSPPSGSPATWAAGALVASGSLHAFAFAPGGNPNPIPGSGPMVVSVVGAVGQIPSVFP